VWKNRATFEAWTKSEAFRAALIATALANYLYGDLPKYR
jgi:hypothetical protein